MLGRQDSDDITTPLTRAGTLIELRRGGHRVYWKGKGKEVAEDFPLCDDKGFYALLSIGWYELGELPAGAALADGGDGGVTKSKRRPRTTDKSKRRSSTRKEFDNGEDETDDEPDAVVENASRSDDESDADEVGVQCYQELQRPRRGMEHYWNRVNRGGVDVTCSCCVSWR